MITFARSVPKIDNVVAERAAYLRGKYNMKTPDALIVATALVANAELFITNDQRLEIVKEIQCVSLEHAYYHGLG